MDINDNDPAPFAAEDWECILQHAAIVASTYISMIATIIEFNTIKKDPIPYHTSALSGEAWVIELLVGHPGRIRCELGMNANVFVGLVDELRELGHDDSKFVSLEEQLVIFLYMSVTGLTIRHAGKRFQRSNKTVSWYVQ